MRGYRDTILIGEGGLGRVYRAVRESTGGVVAIKELREVPSASPAWHRAKRELEAMLRLKGHPYVVSIEEIIESSNGPCLVMEYLEGGSLMQRLTHNGPLSPAEFVLVGNHVAQALEAAHEVGIVHRDIKPHNLLVGTFGQVKVADFGIAALSLEGGLSTQTNAFTLSYASPEQLDGAEQVGPASDVYSFAATMSHLGTGRRPSLREHSAVPDLAGHSDWVLAVAFSTDGTRVAASSADGTVLVWDATNGALLTTLGATGDSAVWSVAFNPDGTLLATASKDGIVRIWAV